MAGSIKEFWGKIKARGGGILADRELFSAALIVVVGIASFGLGRLSVHEGRSLAVPEQEPSTFIRIPPGNEAVVSGSLPVSNEAPATTSAVAGEKAYVGSKNSTKYHLPWCSGAARIAEENKVWFASKEEAEAAGYTPAANCKGI